MYLRINKCFFYDIENDVKWTASIKDDKFCTFTKEVGKKRLFARNIFKKDLPLAYIQNLEVFFSSYKNIARLKSHNDKSGKILVKIESEEDTYVYYADTILEEDEKNIFADLKRYFELYYLNEFKPASIVLDSFDGGGPEFSFETTVKGVFTWHREKIYRNYDDDEDVDGAGFSVRYVFYPLRVGVGKGRMKIYGPLEPLEEQEYTITVDNNFKMNLKIKEIINGF